MSCSRLQLIWQAKYCPKGTSLSKVKNHRCSPTPRGTRTPIWELSHSGSVIFLCACLFVFSSYLNETARWPITANLYRFQAIENLVYIALSSATEHMGHGDAFRRVFEVLAGGVLLPGEYVWRVIRKLFLRLRVGLLGWWANQKDFRLVWSKAVESVPAPTSVPSPLGDFWGLSLPKQSSSPPKLKHETL